MSEQSKLKPVTFLRGDYGYSQDNTYQQDLLLRAMQVSMDPKFLMKSAGLKNMAELQRTLDKLCIRKEYHAAMIKNGLDLDFLVRGFKELCNSSSDVVRLGSYKALLKSLGLEDYRESDNGSSNSWEDLVNAAAEMEKRGEISESIEVYDVKVPEIPASEMARKEEEEKFGRELYEEE